MSEPRDQHDEPLNFLELVQDEQFVPVLEKAIDVPADFLKSMYAEPRDAFLIVKAHAVFESLLNQLIEGRLPATAGFAWRLSMTGRASKPELIRHMKLLEGNDLHFVEGLAKIRNRIAHVPRQLAEFSLLEEVRANEKTAAWLVASLRREGSDDYQAKMATLVRARPRLFFSLASYVYMWRLSAQKSKAQLAAAGLGNEVVEALLDKGFSK